MINCASNVTINFHRVTQGRVNKINNNMWVLPRFNDYYKFKNFKNTNVFAVVNMLSVIGRINNLLQQKYINFRASVNATLFAEIINNLVRNIFGIIKFVLEKYAVSYSRNILMQS